MPKKQDVCKACGGYDFSLSDGFMYCDRCGTLLENFEELEDEDGGMHQTLGIAKVKTKKTTEDGKKRAGPRNFEHFASKEARLEKGLEKRSEFLRQQINRKENLPHDASPDYLYSVGLRLAAFTQILSKSSFILVNELGFCQSVQKNALMVLQKYLAHCQVAFCADEQCGADEELRFVAVMENEKYEEEEREEKRRKKLARRGAGVGKLSKSAAAWQLLTQGNLTENLDLESDEDEEEDDEETMDETNIGDETMGFVRKVTTALSKEAVRRASQMLLNLEVLVAVLHSALMCSGYQEVVVSDLARWIREDRFRLTRRSLKTLRIGTVDKANTRLMTISTDHQLKFPLYEIQRTATLFQQSVNLAPCQAPPSFEKLAARLIDNLNLPIDLLCRVLLLESIIPCDVSPGLKNQAKVHYGRNLSDLAGCQKEEMTAKFMECFGRKGNKNQERITDEVLLSPETKLVAYILLALKLTFDIDHEPANTRIEEEDDDEDEADLTVTRHFTIDTWIHQLEMRLKCWQGHDMTMVLRPHCPVPEMRQSYPFGDNFLLRPRNHKISCLRRQLGFRQCIPSEMSFHSTANLPTVFDLRENRYRTERNRPEALMAPLKFQTVVLQREMDSGGDKYRLADKQSIKTFFRDFVDFKSTDVCETFEEFFPFSSCYESYARPSLLANCAERKTRKTPVTGPYRFYLSTPAAEDILSVASASFSPRFRFLLNSLSLIIGEDERAVYSAFVMLETLLLNSEGLDDMKNDLLTSNPIPIDGLVYNRKKHHRPVKYGIVASQPVETLDELRDFSLSCRFFEHPELATETEDIEFLRFSRNCHFLETTDNDSEQEFDRAPQIGHNFDKLLSILALKTW